MGNPDFFCEWQPSEQDKRLHDLVTRYHTECEAYDRTVCTGPVIDGSIMPANSRELAQVGRNSIVVRRVIETEAAREGIGREDLAMAISKWDQKRRV